MKTFKKVLFAALAVMMIAACAITMTACNDKKTDVKLTATYASTPQLTYNNMRPNYNYFLTTFAGQTLETYDDGTYCLIETSITYSGLILPAEGNDAQTGSAQTTSVKKYYGTFTSAVDEFDEDVLNVMISKPTRLAVAGNGMNIYYDTANWTDAMQEKSSASSEAGGNTIPGETENGTSAEYLEKYAFEEKTIAVTKTVYKFNFVSLAK